MRFLTILTATMLLAAALLFVLLPVSTTMLGALTASPSPGGFGLGPGAISRLAGNTLITSIGGTVIGLGIVVAASVVGIASPAFRRFYRAWLAAMLFTNPVFLVLGLSVLLAELPPLIAVMAATALVVSPLGGLIVEAAIAEFPRAQIDAARSLGSGTFEVFCRHILPAVAGQIQMAGLLMTIYAMGFYLLPSYVGLGRTPTLASATSSLVAQLGDWPAAQQMAALLIGLELIILALWWVGLSRRREYEACNAPN